jgi:hypothetical protein
VMGPAGRRQEIPRYVPPRRSDEPGHGGQGVGSPWRDRSAAHHHRSQWHDERAASPEEDVQQQQRQQPPVQQPCNTGPLGLESSLYDSGSWTDQVEQELGEGLRTMSLTTGWPAGTQSTPSTAVNSQPIQREFSSPRQAATAAGTYGTGPRSSRGRGRGFPPRLGGSADGDLSSAGGGKKPVPAVSPPRWKDRPDYPGNEFRRDRGGGDGGGGGGGGRYNKEQFINVGREEEEDESHSVISSTATEREPQRWPSERKGGGRDLRETLEQRRRQLANSGRDGRQNSREEAEGLREPTYDTNLRGSQSSLNSLDRRRGGSGNRRKNSGRSRTEHSQEAANNQRPSLPRPKKNTENFNPSYIAPEMRILFAPPNSDRYERPLSTRDVLVVADLFCAADDLSIYNGLLRELEQTGLTEKELWQSWHGDSHVIADDRRNWKDRCPTFHWVLDRIKYYFNMEIKVSKCDVYTAVVEGLVRFGPDQD